MFGKHSSSVWSMREIHRLFQPSVIFGNFLGFWIRLTNRIAHLIVKIVGRRWEEGPERSIRQRAMRRLKGQFVKDNIMVIYPSFLGFGLMRSLEITMYRKTLHLFQRPISDLGCRDGVFSSLLFKEIDAGIDLDRMVL